MWELISGLMNMTFFVLTIWNFLGSHLVRTIADPFNLIFRGKALNVIQVRGWKSIIWFVCDALEPWWVSLRASVRATHLKEMHWVEFCLIRVCWSNCHRWQPWNTMWQSHFFAGFKFNHFEIWLRFIQKHLAFPPGSSERPLKRPRWTGCVDATMNYHVSCHVSNFRHFTL